MSLTFLETLRFDRAALEYLEDQLRTILETSSSGISETLRFHGRCVRGARGHAGVCETEPVLEVEAPIAEGAAGRDRRDGRSSSPD